MNDVLRRAAMQRHNVLRDNGDPTTVEFVMTEPEWRQLVEWWPFPRCAADPSLIRVMGMPVRVVSTPGLPEGEAIASGDGGKTFVRITGLKP